MVQLIVTDHLRSACQLALESRELPASWPSRAEIEEAAIPPTKKELQERQLAAASAKKDSETRVSDANNRDADRKDAQGPTKSQDKTSETQEAPTVSVPPPKTISHKAVKDLSDFLLSNVCKDMPTEERERYTVSQLVKQGGIYVEPPKPRVKSEALLKILNDIKSKQQHEEYEKMMFNGGPRAQFFGVQLRQTVQEFRRTGRWLSGILNVIFSVVAVFFGGLLLGAQMSPDWGMRVLVGFGCAFVVLVAEAYFFYFYNLLPEVTDPDIFSFSKKRAPKKNVGPNQEALAKNRAAAESYALEESEKPKAIDS